MFSDVLGVRKREARGDARGRLASRLRDGLSQKWLLAERARVCSRVRSSACPTTTSLIRIDHAQSTVSSNFSDLDMKWAESC